jgi:hypothetical protein
MDLFYQPQMGPELILQLFGKLLNRVITGVIAIASVITFETIPAFAQHNTTHWEIAIQGTIHPPIKSSLDIGTEKLKFLPCAGWNFRVGYKLGDTKKFEYFVYLTRGNTPYWSTIKLYQDKYPQLRDSWIEKFYIVHHPYFALGVYVNYVFKKSKNLSVYFGNRFYVSAVTSSSLTGYDAATLKGMTIFESETETNFHFFCPELNLAFSDRIWKRFPSWNYEVMVSFAPIKVVEGGYTFFPDYPDGSLGYFKLQQSYFGVGVKYRRVAKEEK